MVDAVSLSIRPYSARDQDAVRELFERINRELAPPDLREPFERYILRARHEEIDRIPAYYAERDGGFWVAEDDAGLVGMFGLEGSGMDAVELRRMYVAARARRRGVGRRLLAAAEEIARQRGFARVVLGTSELQQPAIELYRGAGYRLIREDTGSGPTHKTVGGLRRFYFEKDLGGTASR
jgi:GNAT superfamily N-acetyltransferase